MANSILDKARAIIALERGTTPDPWRYGALEHGGRCVTDGRGYLFAQVDDDGNGRFIAESRTTAPELAAFVLLVDAKLAEYRSTFERAVTYWTGTNRGHATEAQNSIETLDALRRDIGLAPPVTQETKP